MQSQYIISNVSASNMDQIWMDSFELEARRNWKLMNIYFHKKGAAYKMRRPKGNVFIIHWVLVELIWKSILRISRFGVLLGKRGCRQQQAVRVACPTYDNNLIIERLDYLSNIGIRFLQNRLHYGLQRLAI